MAEQPFTEEDVQRYAWVLATYDWNNNLSANAEVSAGQIGEVRAVLAALAEDGKLRQSGGHEQWALWRDDAAWFIFDDADEVPDFRQRHMREGDEIVRRWLGPWEPVPDTPDDQTLPAVPVTEEEPRDEH